MSTIQTQSQMQAQGDNEGGQAVLHLFRAEGCRAPSLKPSKLGLQLMVHNQSSVLR